MKIALAAVLVAGALGGTAAAVPPSEICVTIPPIYVFDQQVTPLIRPCIPAP